AQPSLLLPATALGLELLKQSVPVLCYSLYSTEHLPGRLIIMQLVLAIIQDRDTDISLERLVGAGIPVTRIATSGVFIRKGYTTLLMGVDPAKVRLITEILQETCHRRTMYMPMAAGITDPAYGLHNQIEVEVGGASIFVFEVEHYEQV